MRDKAGFPSLFISNMKLLKIKSKHLTAYYNPDDKRHRDNDLPAVIWPNGTQSWFQNGKLHRNNDLPAVIWSDGRQWWYQNGKRHRDNNLPAIVYRNGDQYWYCNGKFIRSETT